MGCDWCVFFILSFQKSCDGVTVSEISGQELSLTTSQTGNSISWVFEVSVNVSGCEEGGGSEGGDMGGGKRKKEGGRMYICVVLVDKLLHFNEMPMP